jgi:hypothetical protein
LIVIAKNKSRQKIHGMKRERGENTEPTSDGTRAYAAALASMKALTSNGCKDSAQLSAAAAAIKAAKKTVLAPRYQARTHAKELKGKGGLCRRGFSLSECVPLDADGFATSFECPTLDDALGTTKHIQAKEFFEEYGYVVFRGAVDRERCEATCSEIWDYWEDKTPGLERGNFATYDGLSSLTYGLAPEAAIFSPAIVQNRQNPNVVAALSLLVGTDDVLVSQDRFCLYRPTRGIVESPGAAAVDKPEWKTRGNLHLDIHPWHYLDNTTEIEDLAFDNLRDFPRELNMATSCSGPHVQGVLSLQDSRAEDGGTLIVPRFHHNFSAWVTSMGPPEGHLDDSGHANWLTARQGGGASYKFVGSDSIYDAGRRVPVRQGSFLLWDQRVAHGSQPNDSDKHRIAQFIKAVRREPVSARRQQRRSNVIETAMTAAGTIDLLTPLGRRVFGLDAAVK